MAKRTLNDRMLKALKPAAPGKRDEVWDALVPGLGIRVTDKGAKTFVLTTRYPGSTNPARRALGGYGELTLEQARAKARGWLELVSRGVDPHVEIERQRLAEQRKQAGTFANLAEDFIREKLSTERRGHDSELQLRRVFIPKWGKRPVAEIEPADVKVILRELKAAGKIFMAHALLTTVRRLFSWGIDQGDYGLVHSPCDHLRARSLIGEKRPRSRVLNDDEIRAFVRACNEMGYPYGPLGKMLLLTAARHSEVSGAHWSEFDLNAKVWTVPAERFKSDAPHRVPLTDDVLALLSTLPRFNRGDHLFSMCWGERPTRINHEAKTRLDQAVGPGWKIHDLRRSVRTHLAALRIPDHIAEMVLGHAKRGLQRIYDQHTYEIEVREALELWAARLRSILEPTPAAKVVPLTGRPRRRRA